MTKRVDDDRPSSPLAVHARGVGKVFQPPQRLTSLLRGRWRTPAFTALQDVSFAVAPGEAFGVMGPNGARKSTLLRILAGVLLPCEGDVRVCGFDARSQRTALARRVGFVAADERGLEPTLSPREHLAWHAALHGMRRGEALRRVDAVLTEVSLGKHALRPMRELSTGMRRRTALARALLAEPRLLLLDEPTRGVDPAGVTTVHEALRGRLRGGCALVIATHDAAEACRLCARVAVMQASRLVAIDAPHAAAARVLEMHIA